MEISLKTLNPEQTKAVTFDKGPLLIIAGAGTGKTAVITQRIAWLIDQKKAKADEILALTFTDKAASEMEERIDKALPYGYVDIWVSTFHAFGERVLRDHAIEIGLNSGFKVLSTAEQWLLVRQNLDKFQLKYYKPLGNPTKFIYALVQHFSRVKDENISPKEYLDYAKKNAAKFKSAAPSVKEEAAKVVEVAAAYKTYNDLLLKDGNLDFGDLIIRTLELFKKRKSILDFYQKKFKYILVDEFQDTNFAQYELIKMLAQPLDNLTVTGDDDQSIYKFRGAAISNILEFKKDFPHSQEVVLVKNYRSNQNILDLTYEFIQLNNPNRLESKLSGQQINQKGKKLHSKISKKLSAQQKGLGIIKLLKAQSAEEEVLNVLREILRLKKENKKLTWNDFAILVRANSQADIFINTFANQNVPYQFVASRGLYQKPEIIDLISYLKMLDNYHESLALFRVLSMDVFDLATRDIIRLLNWTKQKNISLYTSMERSKTISGLSDKTVRTVHQILKMIKEHTSLAKAKSVSQIVYAFLKDTDLIEFLQKNEDSTTAEKILNISKFYKKVQEFELAHQDKSVKSFISELNLIQEIGEDPAPVAYDEGPESVKIMTVHGAKGLEFANVFVSNLADLRFPSTERRDPIELPDELVKEIIPEGDIHLQEERRLFYVACTRAKSSLYFTFAENYGGTRKKRPSRFLSEVNLKKYVETDEQKQISLPFTKDFTVKVKKDKELLDIKLPTRLSFTQLKAFETCPKQYKFAHILKIPVSGRHSFSFGKSIHGALKDFYDKIRAGEQPSADQLVKLYHGNWYDDWYDSKRHEEQRKKSGEEALRQYYQANKKFFNNPPKYLEKGFSIKVGEYSIRGFIDRVDQLPDDKVEIIDYKTGRVPKTKKDVDYEQLFIYAMAAEQALSEEAGLLSFYYLEGNQKFSVSPTEEDINAVTERIKDTAQKIYQSDFKATPSVFKCRYCDFKEICDDRVV
ncbi:MAG: UvrD-helicase domain-containing protein [Patescibacteria group bacterium]